MVAREVRLVGGGTLFPPNLQALKGWRGEERGKGSKGGKEGGRAS